MYFVKICIFAEHDFIMTSFGFFIELKSFKIPLSPLEFRKQQKDTFGSKDYLNKYLLSGHKVPKYRRIYQSKMYKLYIITTWTTQGQLDYHPSFTNHY